MLFLTSVSSFFIALELVDFIFSFKSASFIFNISVKSNLEIALSLVFGLYLALPHNSFANISLYVYSLTVFPSNVSMAFFNSVDTDLTLPSSLYDNPKYFLGSSKQSYNKDTESLGVLFINLL